MWNMFKVTNKDTRRRSGVFIVNFNIGVFIVNFEHILHLDLMSPLLTLRR